MAEVEELPARAVIVGKSELGVVAAATRHGDERNMMLREAILSIDSENKTSVCSLRGIEQYLSKHLWRE